MRIMLVEPWLYIVLPLVAFREISWLPNSSTKCVFLSAQVSLSSLKPWSLAVVLQR